MKIKIKRKFNKKFIKKFIKILGKDFVIFNVILSTLLSFSYFPVVFAQETNSAPRPLLANFADPDKNPEKFYLEAVGQREEIRNQYLVQEEGQSPYFRKTASDSPTIIEPEGKLIQGKRFVPYRFYLSGDYEVEFKSERGVQKLKIPKSKFEYELFETADGRNFKLAVLRAAFELQKVDFQFEVSPGSKSLETTPEPTPTSVPIFEPSPEPTSEPVIEPTPELTSEPTPEPTSVPSPEALEGTPEPTPEQTLLFNIFPRANAAEEVLNFGDWHELLYQNAELKFEINQDFIKITQTADLNLGGVIRQAFLEIKIGFDGFDEINKWSYGIKEVEGDQIDPSTLRVKLETAYEGKLKKDKKGADLIELDLEIDEKSEIRKESLPEPTPKTRPELTPEPVLEPSPELTPEPVIEPTPELTPEPTSVPSPEALEGTPEPTLEPILEPVPSLELSPEVTPEPAPEPEPSPQSRSFIDRIFSLFNIAEAQAEEIQTEEVEIPAIQEGQPGVQLPEPEVLEATGETTEESLQEVIGTKENIEGEGVIEEETAAEPTETEAVQTIPVVGDFAPTIEDITETVNQIVEPIGSFVEEGGEKSMVKENRRGKPFNGKVRLDLRDHKGKHEQTLDRETKKIISYLYNEAEKSAESGLIFYADPSFGAVQAETGITVQSGDGTKPTDFKIHFNQRLGGAIDELYSGGDFTANKVALPNKETGGLTLINIGNDHQTDYQSIMAIEEKSKARIVVKNEVIMDSSNFSELYSIYSTGRIVKKIFVEKNGASEEKYYFNSAKGAFDTVYLDTENFGSLIVADNETNKNDLLAYWQNPAALSSGSYSESETEDSFNTVFSIVETEGGRTYFQLIEIGKTDLSLLEPGSYAGYPMDYRNPDNIGPTFKKGTFSGFNFGSGVYSMEAVENTVIFTLNGSEVPRFQPVFEISNWTSDDFGRFIATLNQSNLIEGVHFAIDFVNGDRNTTTLLFQYFGVVGVGEEFTVNGFGEFNIDPTLSGSRVNTVEFFGGQYSSTTAQNDSTVNAFPQQAFKLGETSASIKDAYIEVSMETGAPTASSAIELLLYFDACNEPCTPSPVIKLDTAQYTTTSGESNFIVARASVSSEAQLLAYTGQGASVSFQISYCLDGTNNSACSGAANAYTQAANAKLVITYTYDATSSMLTNTVIYTVASGSDVGSKPGVQASCAIDTNCPKFYYNAEIPEFSSNAASRSQFFFIQAGLDANTTTDLGVTPQIDGSTTGTGVTWEEALSGNGGAARYYFAGLAGYANNTAQRLEIENSGTGVDRLGGENYVTYTYLATAATKTKTVVYSVGGICTTGCVTLSALEGPDVFFPETGVTVKKAWFRVQTSYGNGTGATTNTLDIVTKVGNNAQTASTAYTFTSDVNNISEDGYLIHLIPSADYAEMALANGKTGKRVQMAADWDASGRGAISAELVITYTYTDDHAGYMQTETIFAGQSSVSAATTFSTGQGKINPVLPETSGTRLIRTASLRTDANGSSATVDPTIGSLLVVGSCTATATSTTDTADESRLFGLWDSTASASMTTSDAQTYTACYISSQTAIFTGTLTITYQVNLPKYTQSAYRFFQNDNATTVTTALANQDTAATLTSDAQIFRLRMLTHVASGSLALNGDTFKLQYALRSGSCDTAFSGETYADIGSNTSISYDTTNTPADGDNLTANNALDPDHGTHASISQDYEEANNFTNSVASIASGSDGLWDFALKDFDGNADDVFCLRAVRSDGVLFTVGSGSYSVIPEITMAAALGGNPTYTQNMMRWYVNTDGANPSDPWSSGTALDLGENFATISAHFTSPDRNIKVRLRQSILIGGNNLSISSQSFRIQFAEVPVGSVGCGGVSSWTNMGASTSSEIWRFGSNTSVTDGAAITTQLSVSDVAGTYEEVNDSAVNPSAVNSGQDIEYDFSLQNNTADAGSMYCFRLSRPYAGSPALDGYNRYPIIITPPSEFGPDKLLRHGSFFTDQGYEQPYFWGGI